MTLTYHINELLNMIKYLHAIYKESYEKNERENDFRFVDDNIFAKPYTELILILNQLNLLKENGYDDKIQIDSKYIVEYFKRTNPETCKK